MICSIWHGRKYDLIYVPKKANNKERESLFRHIFNNFSMVCKKVIKLLKHNK